MTHSGHCDVNEVKMLYKWRGTMVTGRSGFWFYRTRIKKLLTGGGAYEYGRNGEGHVEYALFVEVRRASKRRDKNPVSSGRSPKWKIGWVKGSFLLPFRLTNLPAKMQSTFMSLLHSNDQTMTVTGNLITCCCHHYHLLSSQKISTDVKNGEQLSASMFSMPKIASSPLQA